MVQLARSRRTRVAPPATKARLLYAPRARVALKNRRMTRVVVARLLTVIAGVGKSSVDGRTGINSVVLLASHRRTKAAVLARTACLLQMPVIGHALENRRTTLVGAALLLVVMAVSGRVTEHGE